MTVSSDTEPQPVAIDREEAGTARILVRWNITPVSVAVEGGKARTAYEYEERAVWISGTDPVAALETRSAGILDAASKELVGTTQLVRDTATGLPGRIRPTKDDPTLEADGTVRARREQGYRMLPWPRRGPRLPPATASPPAPKPPVVREPIADDPIVIRRG